MTVGPREDLERTSLTAARVNWMSGDVPPGPVRAAARIRYRHREAPATITPLGDGRASVEFDEAQSAITPGQAVVFYDDDVGAGWWLDRVMPVRDRSRGQSKMLPFAEVLRQAFQILLRIDRRHAA